MRTRSAVSAAAVVAVAANPAGAAAGAEEVGEEHCLLQVIGQAESGEYLTDELVCYPTLDEVFAELGLDRRGIGEGGGQSLSSSTIGVHWDGANRTGSSITVSGTNCNGGYVNLTSNWVNRISSTQNVCPTVMFFDGFDKTGAHETTYQSTVNLGAMNNAANSIAYGT